MNSIIGPILSYILLYKYPVLFVVQFFSALIVPFPANTIMVAMGAFASEGYVSPWLSLAVGIAGNVLGDVAGYYLTHTLLKRSRVIMEYVRGQSAKRGSVYVGRLERAIRRYAGRTIFVTRFTPSLQSTVNILAGLAEVPFRTFLLFDIFGNALNTFSYLLIGWFVGVNWQNITGIFSVAGGLLVVAVLLGATFWVYRVMVSETIA